MQLFDPITYFQTIQTELKDLTGTKRFFRVSGIAHLEELLQNIKRANYPCLCIDDSQDGLISNPGGGYHDGRFYTVFILSRVKVNDSADRQAKVEVCRAIFYKIMARIIRDKNQNSNTITFLDPSRIKYNEVNYLADNHSGVMFSFTINNPVDLTYNESDWNES